MSDPHEDLDGKRIKRKRVTILFGVAIVFLILGGLTITAIAKVRDAQNLQNAMCNVRAMGTALNNLASNSTTGDIPPANGVFPSNDGMMGSFFYHLLPYIEQGNLYIANPPDVPVKTYISPSDARNRGIDSTISYCTNGTLLNQPNPRFPGSFGGRLSGVIVIMQRSGMDGAHKWTNTNNVLGTPGSPPPFPQIGVPPAAYLEGSPQGFSPVGCTVGFGDGSSRMVTKGSKAGWNWACDPTDKSQNPAGW